jgi:hypothetical protein
MLRKAVNIVSSVFTQIGSDQFSGSVGDITAFVSRGLRFQRFF